MASPAFAFRGAQWIWDPDAGHKAGTWYLRKSFEFPAGRQPKSATLKVTCDNICTVYVNGSEVARSDTWQSPVSVDVTGKLTIEQNAIAVKGVNTIPGPAGLILELSVKLDDGKQIRLVSDKTWVSSVKPDEGWSGSGFVGGEGWRPVKVLGPYGMAPWGKPSGGPKAKKLPPEKEYPQQESFKGRAFDAGIVFVGNSLPFSASKQRTYVQYVRGTRAYFEMDPMTPAAIGSQLWSLVPFRPDGEATLLCDAGGGKIGSPSVSYDGKTVYFSMAKGDEPYYHIYAVAPDGSGLRQVTQGPFHDYDPVELPDGRLAFSSTRLGSREEYHAKYASSLFTCNADGSTIRPLTYHIVADREPRVMSDGSLVFVRMDNFMERAKVEVHLHQTRLDGTGGQVIIGPGRKGVNLDRDAAAEAPMSWLRKYGAGSPAPMPDGRVVAINQKGLVTSADLTGMLVSQEFLPYDVSPLAGGRLLCTSIRKSKVLVFDLQKGEVRQVVKATDLPVRDLHSVVSLASRKKPSTMPSMIDPAVERRVDKTGYLHCQNVLNTQHTQADLNRIKAIRIYEGRPFTLEPTKTIYSHIGTVGVELGTVPLSEDGSFYAEVPADRPLAMQAVDGEGRAVINELTWVYTRPGEQRSCVGCHAPADTAPPMSASQALRGRPLKLTGKGEPHRFRANNAANGGIVNLQLDRFREAAAINLHDEEPADTLSMVQRLGLQRDRSAVPVLVKALSNRSAEIRCAAAIALSACGNRDAVKPLQKALEDKHRTVRRAVENALEHLTGSRTGRTDWDALEGELIEKLGGTGHEDVHLALEALGHVGGAAGKAAIRRYLQDNPEGELRVLMAAIRSLGYLEDRQAVPLLTDILNANLTKKGKAGHHEFGYGQKPVYLAATAAEALGRIGGDAAEKALLDVLPRLNSFEDYTFRVADHKWLMGSHSSVMHFRILEALDRMENSGAAPFVGRLVESIPADKDRGLLYELDSYEKLTSKVIARAGKTDAVVEACLAVLVGGSATNVPYADSVGKSPHYEKHIRRHSPEARAAQVLSIICTSTRYADRIRAILETQRAAEPSETRSWCCFMLTRLLGRLRDAGSTDLLLDMLQSDPTEAQLGLNPPPAHIIYGGWRPFYRPAAAWALGELRDARAVPVLLGVVENLDNASSTREQAARSLGRIGDASCLERLKALGDDYPEVMTRRAILEAVEALERGPLPSTDS